MRKILPLFFLLLFTGTMLGQEYQDWKWLHEKPNGNAIRWIKMWDANKWYAIGSAGTFMKTTDGGQTWWWHQKAGYPRLDGSSSFLYDAHFFNQDTGIVVGTSGVMRTTNGGTTFDTVQTNIPYGATAYQVYFLDNNIGYIAGTSTVRMAKTTNGGLTWTLNTVLASASYYDVWSPNDTLLIVAGGSGNIYRSTNGGTSFTTISTGASSSLYKLSMIDSLNGWVAGSAGAARYTTNAGLTWTSANTGLPATDIFYDIDFVPAAPTMFESFENTTFPPDGWQRVNVLGAQEWVRDNYYAIDGLYSAYINYQLTGGEDWLITKKVTPAAGDELTFYVRKQYTSPYMPDSLIVLVSTTDSALGSFTNTLIAIDVANLPNGWNQYTLSNISTYAGQPIFIAFKHKDTDGNGLWLDAVKIAPAVPVNEIWLTGDSFNLYRTVNNGTSWQAVSHLDPAQPWTSTWYSADFYGGKVAAVGAYGMVNSFTIGGTPVAHGYFVKPGTINDIWADHSKIITVGAPSITGSIYDQIMISTNGGTTWTFPTIAGKTSEHQGIIEVPAPVENEGTDNKELLVANSTSTFRSIEMINSTTGFVVGSNGAIYKTTNGGASWDSLVTTIPSTAVLYKVDFVSPSIGWVFNNTSDDLGTVWKTTDGGATWNRQSIGATSSSGRIYGAHMLNENYGWIVNYTPRPYKTTDGGATWVVQPLSDSYGGFLYDIQMIDTSVGFCVGGGGRVYKTTDGGTMWNVLTTPIGTLNTNYDVDFWDANIGYVVGTLGVTMKTFDGGLTWQLTTSSGSSTNYAACIVKSLTSDSTTWYSAGSGGNIWKNSSVIVPVELASFTAEVNGSTVSLNWATATETNNRGYEIERSSATENWKNIGFVNGRGTTTEKSTYQFTDKNLADGKYNYRIKQVDFNGSYKYYTLNETLEISVPLEFGLSQNYPNPFNPVTNINYSLPKASNVTLKVYDVLGNEIATLVNSRMEPGRYQVQFDGSKYSSGVYLYQIKAGDFTSVKKLILMK